MTFINWYTLFGLIAVSIPILIHLFNRRKAKVIDWGAMQFLQGSLVNRRRRVLVEELILMALRCLLIAVVVLAVARPFAPVNSGISWLLLLPLILLAAVVVSVASILARRRSLRWILYLCGVAIVVGVVYLSQNQQLLEAARWKSSTEQDIAIVIDGSNSMRVKVDGQTNFENAVTEARRLVESLGPDDTVSVIVAGSVPRNATSEPVNVRSGVEEVLDTLEPVGGSMFVVESLSTAVSALAKGENAAKKIVLISDGQNVGWDEENQGKWEFLAQTLEQLPTKPKVVSRFVSLPDNYQNAAITSLDLSRNLVGADRKVTIGVGVENTGYAAVEISAVQLQFDGNQVLTADVGNLEAGEATQVNFQHRFTEGGSHVVEAKLLINDDLAHDNDRVRIVHVHDTLPVLLVDGSAQVRPADRATSFLEVALSPPSDQENSADGQPTSATEGSDALVETTVIAAPDLSDQVRFEKYRVVMLVDVPRLGAAAARNLAQFVSRGGGLLVAPGRRAEADFYNNWKLPDGRNVLPALLSDRIVIEEGRQTTRPTEESFKHPALAKLLAASRADISKAVISTYWQLQPPPTATDSLVGASLDGGDPFLVQQPLGRGLTAITATSLDGQGSNLPSLVSFLPLVHELTYELASTAGLHLNREPMNILTIDLPPSNNAVASDSSDTVDEADAADRRSLKVQFPDGETHVATWETKDARSVISVAGATQPGVYQVELDDSLASHLGSAVVREAGRAYLPLAVGNAANESRLAPLTERQENSAARHLDYFRSTNSEQMVAAVVGDIPGHELWKYLAIIAVVILLVESFIARWIAKQRKTGATETVEFISDGERMSTFQEART